MQPKRLRAINKAFLVLFAFAGLLLSSCEDDCDSTITYVRYEPVYMLKEELRTAVKTEPARPLKNPGKVYSFGYFLFINEVEEGIHVFDNSNPAAPQPLSFINIPGNVDLAIKDQTLYADSYIDLVVLNIANPLAISEVNRVENVFPLHGLTPNASQATFLVRHEAKTVTEKLNDCNGNRLERVFFNASDGAGRSVGNGGAPGGGATGKGGSMARFTISGNHLYTVSLSSLQPFNITDQAHPVQGQKINLPWGIETIFPYRNMLFIGSNTGMHIYDNSNPTALEHLSTYAHVRACDPVVVDGDLAWVTLRSGNTCQGFSNQLELINISNPRSPQLVKTFPMQNPHGLGIDNSLLFLCEGQFGLKVFDITDPLKLPQNQLKHYQNQDAFDVIPLGNTLLMIGKDGLYQYDYRNPAAIKLLSKIPVIAPAA